MRLAEPDTHDAARLSAESMMPKAQLDAHTERERTRVTRRKVHA